MSLFPLCWGRSYNTLFRIFPQTSQKYPGSLCTNIQTRSADINLLQFSMIFLKVVLPNPTSTPTSNSASRSASVSPNPYGPMATASLRAPPVSLGLEVGTRPVHVYEGPHLGFLYGEAIGHHGRPIVAIPLLGEVVPFKEFLPRGSTEEGSFL